MSDTDHTTVDDEIVVTVRNHLTQWAWIDEARALRDDKTACVAFIVAHLPDGPGMFFRGFVAGHTWAETAKKLFDAA